MDMPTKKEMLMDATMRIVARRDLAGFSMRQAAKAIRVPEALIYRHYDAKKNLVRNGYKTVFYFYRYYFLFCYILDITGMFAERVMHGRLAGIRTALRISAADLFGIVRTCITFFPTVGVRRYL